MFFLPSITASITFAFHYCLDSVTIKCVHILNFRMTKYPILADIIGSDPAAKLTKNTSDNELEDKNATEDVIETFVDSEKECFLEEQFVLIDKKRLLKQKYQQIKN